jgi:quercetin 2,3-dioxygenase
MQEPKSRSVRQVSSGLIVPEPDGAPMRRYIGTPEIDQIDPFLLLDWFETGAATPETKGFAPHPHRGFETITLMIAGGMEHRDNRGNHGVVGAGGVQLMRAGAGILHAEHPVPDQGHLFGLQLWLNLPQTEKRSEPAYQRIDADEVPVETRSGATVRVISGETEQGTRGPADTRATLPILLDIALEVGSAFSEPLPHPMKGFVIVVGGAIAIAGPEGEDLVLNKGDLGRLGAGDNVAFTALEDARVIFAAAMPLGEPVSRGGPFVMNTRREVLEAFQDYQDGRFGPPLSRSGDGS